MFAYIHFFLHSFQSVFYIHVETVFVIFRVGITLKITKTISA